MVRKNSELAITEKESTEWVKERQDLLVRLGQTKVEKFDCIRKLLPVVVRSLLQSHEYKSSLSEPFNLAIQVVRGKGLSVGRTDEEILAVLANTKCFDAYYDKKCWCNID
ncbi:hypothetical protein Tco_0170039 [Tanacetum coccineum]